MIKLSDEAPDDKINLEMFLKFVSPKITRQVGGNSLVSLCLCELNLKSSWYLQIAGRDYTSLEDAKIRYADYLLYHRSQIPRLLIRNVPSHRKSFYDISHRKKGAKQGDTELYITASEATKIVFGLGSDIAEEDILDVFQRECVRGGSDGEMNFKSFISCIYAMFGR